MAEQPDLSGVPTLQTFFESPELYERYHIHLIGVRPAEEGGQGLGNRRNMFGTPRLVDPVADPYVTVATVGADTGSTDYFAIGKHTFPVLVDSQTPLWDAKCLLIAKKGSTEGIEFNMFDKNHNAQDEAFLGFTLWRSEMPNVTPTNSSVWTDYVRSSLKGRANKLDFMFRVMVTDCSDRIVSQKEMEDMCVDTDQLTYTEVVVPDDDTDDQEDNTLLQCWRHTTSSRATDKAVFWVLGRNDAFMHPHVAKRLFLDNGFDLYVLNYKQTGHCRKRGWVTDAHFNSHNKYGTFDVYNKDIAKSLELISGSREYQTLLGYGT
jgi:hypothetical protein